MGGFLCTADLHVTSRDEHAYRWRVFPFLRRMARRKQASTIVIAGDLGDAKDHHPARLVSRLVAELEELAAPLPGIGPLRVIVLMGNHDYAQREEPFWAFLSKLEGGRIEFIQEPTRTKIDGMRCLLLPHTKEWHNRAAWRRKYKILPVKNGKPRPYKYIITHQTYKGAVASNGQRMNGVPISTMSRANTGGAFVLSGDIHVPQKVGRNITYVGSPYHVNFGDGYEPRILHCEADGFTSIPHRRAVSRHVLKITPADLERPEWLLGLTEGDHAKVRLSISPSEVGDAAAMRADIVRSLEAMGLVHFGTDVEVLKRSEADDPAISISSGRRTPRRVWREYCAARGITGKLVKMGRDLL